MRPASATARRLDEPTHRHHLKRLLLPLVALATVLAVLPLTGGRAGAAENLLSAHSHSIESTTRGWTAQGNTRVSRTTKHAADGRSSLQVTVAKSGWVDATRTARVGTSLVRATPGTAYDGSVQVRAAAQQDPVRCELRWYDGNQGIISTFEGAPVVRAATDSWSTASCRATAPAGARYVALRVHIAEADYGEVYFVDDAWLRTATTTTQPSPTTTAPANPSRTNLLGADAHSVETSAGGWMAQGNTAIARSTAVAAVGKASLEVTVARNGWVDDSRTARVGTTPIPATPGQAYSGTAAVRPQGQLSPVRCELRWYDAGGGIISTFEGAPFVQQAAGTWVRPTCAATAPAGTSSVGLRVLLASADYGAVHHVDDAWLSAAGGGSTSPTPTTQPPSTTTPPTTAPPTTAPPTTTTPPPTTTPPTTSPAPTGGVPGPGNTGVPAGTTLTPSGSITVSTPGAVIDRLDVDGCIFVRANNVTIKRTRVRGSCWGGAIDTSYGEYSGILIEDVEIDGRRQNAQAALLGNSGFTCRRCNIHSGGSGIRMTSNVVIEQSWIHDIYGAGDSHNSTIGSNGGSNFVIRGNNIDCGAVPQCSGALVLYGDFNPIRDVLIEGNLLNGGGYCTYGGSVSGKPYPNATNVRYLNNRFGRTAFDKCGYYGPVTSFDRNGAGNQWSGNVWADTGAPV